MRLGEVARKLSVAHNEEGINHALHKDEIKGLGGRKFGTSFLNKELRYSNATMSC